MRRTLGLFIVAAFLIAISITLASRPQAAAGPAQQLHAQANSQPSKESNSAARASYSTLTAIAPSTQTSSLTALPNRRIYFNSDRDGNAEIYAMNADGSDQTRLTNNLSADADPVWSLTNQKIAFVTNRDGNLEIYTMDAGGYFQSRLTYNSGSDGAPIWSPNGQKIAFTSDRDGNYEIYTMNSDGSGQTRLTFNSSNDINPTWAPDGSKISFQSNRDGNVQIYAINADGSGLTRLTNGIADDWAPDWSPDGTRIVFTSTRDDNQEIYVMNADGSSQTRLTNNTASDALSTWSPDGTRIAFESNRDGNFEIYTINPDGSNQTRLTDSVATDENPSWGPTTYSISGRVTLDEVGVGGISLYLNGTQYATATTDASGNYSFANLPASGNYDIFPSHVNYTFTPAKLSFSNLSDDQTAANIVVTGFRYTISGQITSGGTPLSFVHVDLSGSKNDYDVTDANGNYSFTALNPGNYTITPSKWNYAFSPPSLTFNNLSAHQTSANFDASRAVTGYSIRVIVGFFRAVGGVPVTVTGPTTATGVTNGGGLVEFDNLQPGGNYTVTPSQPGFSFSPSSAVLNNLQSDLIVVFERTPVYRVSGRIADANGNGIPGVTVIMGSQQDPPPTGPLVTSTDANGNYLFDFAQLFFNNQTVAVYPSKAGFSFTPILYRNVAGVDIPGQSLGLFTTNQPVTAVANFTARHSISGRVTDSNGGVSGVTMTLSGQGAGTINTDANGNYSFRNLDVGKNYTVTPAKTGLAFASSNKTFTSLDANQTDVNFAAQPLHAGFEPVVLTGGQAEIKTWTFQGKTYAYIKLLFPNFGYGVINWGQVVKTGNDFAADAAIERSTGGSVHAVTTTAQTYDLGALADGNYTFRFKNSGVLVKSQAFTVSSATPPLNPIDDAREFVKQQYRDFLNREPDQAGEDFWTDNITKCMDPARRPPDQVGQTVEQCTVRQRETTSGAFFLSPEFQYTGYFVYRMHQGALGRPPKLSEFTPDALMVGHGIIVNGQLSGAKINQNKADFAATFVNCVDVTKSRCAEFKAIYDALNNQAYVDKLFQTTGVNASPADRTALVNELIGGASRASVLQKVVDGINVISEGNQQFTTTYGQAFYNSELNRAFVQLEYFGYMRRDPDEDGYAFWLGKLNQFGGDFVAAEMVLAFISSPEYRARFGQP